MDVQIVNSVHIESEPAVDCESTFTVIGSRTPTVKSDVHFESVAAVDSENIFVGEDSAEKEVETVEKEVVHFESIPAVDCENVFYSESAEDVKSADRRDFSQDTPHNEGLKATDLLASD